MVRRIVVLVALAACALAACAPRHGDIIRKTNAAGEPPGDLSTFFAAKEQRDPSIWTEDYRSVTVCGPTSESCNAYESDYLRRFFEQMGTVRYSAPLLQTLTMSVGTQYYQKQAIAERWLTCLAPEESERIYYFFSSGQKLTAVNRVQSPYLDSGGTISYRDPSDEDYQETAERCGPLSQTTRIVLPPA
ncbi:MAG: hypothetical protein Kilf2KO_33450 [Rhodospirillales bacterium]